VKLPNATRNPLDRLNLPDQEQSMKKSMTAAISRGATAPSLDFADLISDDPRSQTGDAADDTTQILKLDLPEAPTVLIVDDDDLVLARLHDLVTAAGYAVRTAATGLEALTLLEESAADACPEEILVQVLAEGDGVQFTRSGQCNRACLEQARLH
jgi:PleD family two-component response regulator